MHGMSRGHLWSVQLCNLISSTQSMAGASWVRRYLAMGYLRQRTAARCGAWSVSLRALPFLRSPLPGRRQRMLRWCYDSAQRLKEVGHQCDND